MSDKKAILQRNAKQNWMPCEKQIYIHFNQDYWSTMLSHDSEYYCKSMTTNKVKSQSINQFFWPGGTSSDKEQLSIHEVDVSKKRFVIFSVKEILVAYLFPSQTFQIFLLLCLKKKKIWKRVLTLKVTLVNIS